jgi:hypothetical protein
MEKKKVKLRYTNKTYKYMYNFESLDIKNVYAIYIDRIL